MYALALVTTILSILMSTRDRTGGGNVLTLSTEDPQPLDMAVIMLPIAIALFATIRSRNLADADQARLNGFFRLPLNMIVAAGTLATSSASSAHFFLLSLRPS